MTRAHGRPPWMLFAGAVLFGLVAACSARSPGPGADSGTPIASSIRDPVEPRFAARGAARPLRDRRLIPYNLEEDCPGCTGFVDSYALALEERLGRPVEVNNYSRHDGARPSISSRSSPLRRVSPISSRTPMSSSCRSASTTTSVSRVPSPLPEPVSEQDSDEAWVRAFAHTSARASTPSSQGGGASRLGVRSAPGPRDRRGRRGADFLRLWNGWDVWTGWRRTPSTRWSRPPITRCAPGTRRSARRRRRTTSSALTSTERSTVETGAPRR